MMYMCICAFKHLLLHEPVLNSTQTQLENQSIVAIAPAAIVKKSTVYLKINESMNADLKKGTFISVIVLYLVKR